MSVRLRHLLAVGHRYGLGCLLAVAWLLAIGLGYLLLVVGLLGHRLVMKRLRLLAIPWLLGRLLTIGLRVLAAVLRWLFAARLLTVGAK